MTATNSTVRNRMPVTLSVALSGSVDLSSVLVPPALTHMALGTRGDVEAAGHTGRDD